jgi:hypothetical protein
MQDQLTVMFERRAEGLCPFCGKVSTHAPFTSEIAKREHAISGMCNPCQEDFFSDPDSDSETK